MNQNEVATLVIDLKKQLVAEFPFLKNWQVTYDYAKRRAGLCNINRKLISISHFHYKNNAIETVTDTILHEYAHAIAFELYRYAGHGKIWKEIAFSIGAVPKATGLFKVPEAPWVLIRVQEDKPYIIKLGTRYRRNRNVKYFMLKGSPSTQGQLYYIKTQDFNAYQQGELLFAELTLVQ